MDENTQQMIDDLKHEIIPINNQTEINYDALFKVLVIGDSRKYLSPQWINLYIVFVPWNRRREVKYPGSTDRRCFPWKPQCDYWSWVWQLCNEGWRPTYHLALDMGHGWVRVLQKHNEDLLQGQSCRDISIWRNISIVVREYTWMEEGNRKQCW